MSDFREDSRKNWTSIGAIEHINAGSLQRIADACEKMAADFDRMRRRAESAEQSRDLWMRQCDELRFQIRALKGANTKLKRARAEVDSPSGEKTNG